jgi:hypothetical protein
VYRFIWGEAFGSIEYVEISAGAEPSIYIERYERFDDELQRTLSVSKVLKPEHLDLFEAELVASGILKGPPPPSRVEDGFPLEFEAQVAGEYIAFHDNGYGASKIATKVCNAFVEVALQYEARLPLALLIRKSI